MSRLPAFLMILAFCLTVLAPAQAAGFLQGDSKCRHLASAAAALENVQSPDGAPGAPGAPAGAPCKMACAIVGTAIGVPSNAIDSHRPVSVERLTIAKRPAGIDRPPRA
ncbi:MAG: hypothetical protein IBJ07_00810 [Rhizobiaceae bacterium]|nr:hypothetical protein [Rhizobiaceae bacterium]